MFAFDYFDLDGSWVSHKSSLSSQWVIDSDFAWGKGKTIVEGSIDFGYKKNRVRLPGCGGYFIEEKKNVDDNTVYIVLISVGDKEKKRPQKALFHFISIDELWIESEDLEDDIDVGPDKRLYRLSGPDRRNGIINDNRVRIRSGSNLNSSILGHVGQGDKVKITEQTESRQKIDDMEAPWLKIITMEGVEGWVYGAYVDIVP
jgi:hypothetical protein